MDISNEIKYVAYCSYLGTKSFLTYRAQAALWVVVNFLPPVFAFITIGIIYNVSAGIAGWTYYQMLLLSATTILLNSLINTVVSPYPVVRKMLTGGIDIDLTKPISRMSAVMASAQFPLTSVLSGVASAMLVFAYAIPHLQISAINIAGAVFLFFLAMVALIPFGMMITALSYYLLKSANLARRILNFSSSVGGYPMSVYGYFGQLIFTLLIPFGLAYYYPAEVLLGKIGIMQYLILSCIALAIALASYLLFERVMREYASGGG